MKVQLGQRAAIYCRVSTVDQSCGRQERDLSAFASRAGYDVVATFNETGSGAKLDRAERKKVLALAQARQIDVILVTELSRWGHSTIDLLNYAARTGELEGFRHRHERNGVRPVVAAWADAGDFPLRHRGVRTRPD